MSRYIDADLLVKRLTDLHDWCRDERKKGLEQSICIIHEQPTANVTEVVRCRDCKHYNHLYECCKNRSGMRFVKLNGYCSHGERNDTE